MFSQSADQRGADQSDAPAGMRELPPQPAKPVMPAYATSPASPATAEPAADETRPGPDDSVIARDDHLEGTFTSRGTVVVMGSVKGRIEAVRVRIEDGATVDADVIVDEAIIAGEFTGNLTCRERLEARASGRINGRVETFRLMLHEGASVEGEMHMLTESPRDASETIRGSAPLRGDAGSASTPASKAEPTPEAKTATTSAKPAGTTSPAGPAAPAPRQAPAITLPSSPRPSSPAAPPDEAPTKASSTSPTPGAEASAVRSSVAETLRAESLRLAPRATVTTTSRGYGSSTRTSPNGSRDRSTSTTGF